VQPFRDLGFVRLTPAEALTRAQEHPYAAPATLANGATDCPALTSEIVSLDIALGSDVDVAEQRQGMGSNLVAGAIRSAVSLPYRSVVRRITGAEHRDQVMQQATRAGMVRRAFLKGLRMRDCPHEQPGFTVAARGDLEEPHALAVDVAPQIMTASVEAAHAAQPPVPDARTMAIADLAHERSSSGTSVALLQPVADQSSATAAR